MISCSNSSLNQQPVDSDFTVNSYRELLVIAKQRYTFASYNNIPWGQKFVLWRHDCDYSLNRSYDLATIEAAEGIRATYFLNPHSEFYNLFEKKQHRLVLDILKMGHEIGLHFDGAFHGTSDEAQLNDQISTEAALLEDLYGTRPQAFSFHNPIAAHLSCEKEMYGNLVNCYSQRFKKEIPYCSDSNGYWRFRRLRNVLSEGTDPCLQVLTHPGWWQKSVMPPRQRIFRSIYGRARATLQDYDSSLESHDRLNHAGSAGTLLFLKNINPRLFELCDYLWNNNNFQALFLELWILHIRQIIKLCKAELHKQWGVPAIEISNFFEDPTLAVDELKLFKTVFCEDWSVKANINQGTYNQLSILRSLLISGCTSVKQQQLEDSCQFLCAAIEVLAAWGKKRAINFDGIDYLDSISIPNYIAEQASTTDLLEEAKSDISIFPEKKWEELKNQVRKS